MKYLISSLKNRLNKIAGVEKIAGGLFSEIFFKTVEKQLKSNPVIKKSGYKVAVDDDAESIVIYKDDQELALVFRLMLESPKINGYAISWEIAGFSKVWDGKESNLTSDEIEQELVGYIVKMFKLSWQKGYLQ
jgi:hypothetical protein